MSLGFQNTRFALWMRRIGLLIAASALVCPALAAAPPPAPPAQKPATPAAAASADQDKTLAAMHDELERSRTRLFLPGQEKPYYIEYRLLDLDQRTIVAEFGSIVSSTSTRTRYMSVDVRVGDYHVDSSNFISGGGFRGFLDSTGTVGIDGDYDSLRQDLWLATDQAYKQALDQLSGKRAFLRNLANAPTIDDFSQIQPMVTIEPKQQPDWSNRNWEAEASEASRALRAYPEINGSRVVYRLTYTTTYLMTTEGTQIRAGRSLASIEAGMGAIADDGTPVHNYLALYATKPAGLPSADDVKQRLDAVGRELVALRSAPRIPDYDGPVLFEPKAAAALLAQLLGPSLGGARPLLSANPRFDQMQQALGGRSEWSGRISQRVMPVGVSLLDDPTIQSFQGQALIGSYVADQEGVKAQRVGLVANGILRSLLMSRRPGPELTESNGHGRSVNLADARPMPSNLFFSSSDEKSPQELKQDLLTACREDGLQSCLIVRAMDNPVIASSTQDELSDVFADLATTAPNGDRYPLLVYRVNVADGHEDLVRGAILSRLSSRALRTIAGIGNDPTVFSYLLSQDAEIAGTALGAFGTSDNGVPTTLVAPSLLLDEIEVRGPHNEARRLPLVAPPPL
jgi:PmbA/TldA metallopeptidase C-terminal domain